MTGQNDARMLAMMALDAAEWVLPLFEKRHPEDRRPGRCIEAARSLLDNEEKRPEAQQALADAISAYHAADRVDSKHYAQDAREFGTDVIAAARAAVADRTEDCCTSVYPSTMAVQAVISAAYAAFAAVNENTIAAACYASRAVCCAVYAPTYEVGREAARASAFKTDADNVYDVAYSAAKAAVKQIHSIDRTLLVCLFTRRYAARWEAVQLVVGS